MIKPRLPNPISTPPEPAATHFNGERLSRPLVAAYGRIGREDFTRDASDDETPPQLR